MLTVVVGGCGGSAVATKTVTVTAVRTVTGPAASRTVTEPPRTRTVTVAAVTRTATLTVATSTPTRTVTEPALTAPTVKTVVTSGGGLQSAASYHAALAAFARECRSLPLAASVPASRDNKARTIALIVLPRALPLRQLIDRIAGTYAGDPRVVSATRPLRRATAHLTTVLQQTLAGKLTGGTIRLTGAIKAVDAQAVRLSLRSCTV